MTQSQVLQSFELFPRLPLELRAEIWQYAVSASRRRLLSVYFNHDSDSWLVFNDSIGPSTLANVCEETRQLYTFLFGAYVLLEKDIFLIADPTFVMRRPQELLLNQGQQLLHLALTNDVFAGLRHTHHDFPDVTLSAAGPIRKLEFLETFTLIITAEDEAEFETDSYGYEGEWTEDSAGAWLEMEEDPDGEVVESERAQRHREVVTALDSDNPLTLTADENGTIPAEAKADRFLSGLEIITMTDLQIKKEHRRKGPLRLRSIHYEPNFPEHDTDFHDEIQEIFAEEKIHYPSFTPPQVYVFYLGHGEMPYDNEAGESSDASSSEGEENISFDESSEDGDADDSDTLDRIPNRVPIYGPP